MGIDGDDTAAPAERADIRMDELVRGNFLDRVHLGMDFFDASINRIAAWVIGARATRQALLLATREPPPGSAGNPRQPQEVDQPLRLVGGPVVAGEQL